MYIECLLYITCYFVYLQFIKLFLINKYSYFVVNNIHFLLKIIIYFLKIIIFFCKIIFIYYKSN
jgi:hypothetical protein